MRFLILILILNLLGTFSYAALSDCSQFLASLKLLTDSSSNGASSAYVNLVRYLAKEKNALTSVALAKMAVQKSAPNPMDYVSDSLSLEEKYSFKKAFATVKGINWEHAQRELKDLAQESSKGEGHREDARKETESVFLPVERGNFSWPIEVQVGQVFETSSKLMVLAERHLIFQNSSSFFIYDLEKRTSQDLNGSGDKLILKSEKTKVTWLIQTNGRGYELSHFEPDGRIIPNKLPLDSKDIFKADFFEDSAGEPTSVHTKYRKDGSISSFVEMNLLTQGTKEIHLPQVNNTDYFYTTDGNLISAHIDLGKKLEFYNLSAQTTISRVDLPKTYDSKHGWLDAQRINNYFRYSLGSAKNALMIWTTRSQNNVRQISWVDIGKGKLFEPEDNLDKSVVVIPTSDGYFVEEGRTGLKQISVFDPASESFNNFDIQSSEVSTQQDRLGFNKLVKLKNGMGLVVTAQDESGYLTHITLMRLPKGPPMTIGISRLKLRELHYIRETADGRIEGLFGADNSLADTSLKLIQLLGPVPKGKNP